MRRCVFLLTAISPGLAFAQTSPSQHGVFDRAPYPPQAQGFVTSDDVSHALDGYLTQTAADGIYLPLNGSAPMTGNLTAPGAKITGTVEIDGSVTMPTRPTGWSITTPTINLNFGQYTQFGDANHAFLAGGDFNSDLTANDADNNDTFAWLQWRSGKYIWHFTDGNGTMGVTALTMTSSTATFGVGISTTGDISAGPGKSLTLHDTDTAINGGPSVSYFYYRSGWLTGIGNGEAFNGISVAGYQETLTTPASSSAACTAGQFTDDKNYHYVCTDPNHWRRVALGDF